MQQEFAASTRLDPTGSPLIDREHELGELRAALAAAVGGDGRVVLLGGEPGIGKTRLARALVDEAAAQGIPIWWGRTWEDGSAPAFWPWNTALRGWIHQAGDEQVAAAAGTWLSELSTVFTVLRERLADSATGPSSESDSARFRLFDTVSRFLGAFAAPAGLVVVLDDVHWADRPSLKLLEFIAADIRDKRLLVIATYRDTEVRREDALFEALAHLAREPATRRLFVSGLSAAECTRWVAPLLEPHADAEAFAESLHRETNGNPFFLGEIVRLLGSEGGLGSGWDTRRVPQGVRAVIAQRLNRLGDDCHAALAVAALVGATFDAAMVGDILDDARTSDHLQRAVDDRILVTVRSRPDLFGFAHALIRRVLVDELPPSVRAGWHARIAEVLERRAAASDVVTTELVRHFAGAGTPEALRKAFDHACRGAEQAARGFGWEEAVRLYEIALDAGERCGALDPERAIELRLALARALRGAGDVPAARVRCEEVMAACRSTDRPVPLARAALLHAGPLPEFGRVDPTERAVLEEGCKAAERIDDDGLRARLYARLAGDIIAANEVAQGARAVALCDEATQAARRAGDSAALAMALTGTYYTAALRMRPRGRKRSDDAVPSLQEILEAAEAGGDHDFAAAVRHLRAASLFAIGEADAFSAEVDDLATAAAGTRAPAALWLADALAALRATVTGRLREARDLMDRALTIGRRMQLPNAVGQHMSQVIMWHFVQGRLGEIAAEIDAFVDEHPHGLGWQPIRAMAKLACGDAFGARAEFETLLATGLAPAESGVMSRCYLGALGHLCIALEDREHAGLLYDRIARRREAWIIDGCQTLGPWSLVLGELARLRGRAADASRHLENAVALAQRMQAVPFVAHAQAALAAVRTSMHPASDGDATAALLAEAERSAREFGLRHVGAAVDALRGPAGGHSETRNAFRRDGDIWTVCYGGRDLRLKDGKGPRYLATLLAAPGHEFHVQQLAGALPGGGAAAAVADGLSIGGAGATLDDGPDDRARRAYRARLEDLREELDEAERDCDDARAEHLRAELDSLTAQLAQRFGGHARARGPSETARKAVTKVLRTQIGKLLDVHPPLGQHLRDSLRMGTVCVYAPATPTTWDVVFGR